jgi:7-carboxy-7-deazaguanine synthase
MAKIKIAELFYSIQGEGRYMGVPSVFLRTFGCNFKCAGFGMPAGQLSTEADTIAIQHEKIPYKNYEDLPLVSTGCDSYASWHPSFKDTSPMLTIDAIASRCSSILPGGSWGDTHLVITGGEPLLGWQRSYPELLTHPTMSDLKEITFETNGTQELSASFYNFLRGWVSQDPTREITFSVSPKISTSGEAHDEAIKPKVVCEYEDVGTTYLKFVVAHDTDIAEIESVVEEYRAEGFKGYVYLMPCGGVENVYALNNRAVAEMAMKKGWRYSDRLQVPLFKNEWGT